MPSASASVKLLCAETDDWAASKSTAEQRDWRLALILNSKLWCWNIGQCWSHVWKEQQYQNSGVVLQFVTTTRQPKLRSLPFPVQTCSIRLASDHLARLNRLSFGEDGGNRFCPGQLDMQFVRHPDHCSGEQISFVVLVHAFKISLERRLGFKRKTSCL